MNFRFFIGMDMVPKIGTGGRFADYHEVSTVVLSYMFCCMWPSLHEILIFFRLALGNWKKLTWTGNGPHHS